MWLRRPGCFPWRGSSRYSPAGGGLCCSPALTSVGEEECAVSGLSDGRKVQLCSNFKSLYNNSTKIQANASFSCGGLTSVLFIRHEQGWSKSS